MRSFFPDTKSPSQCITLMDNIILGRNLKPYPDGLWREPVDMKLKSHQSEFVANELPHHEVKSGPLV